MESETQGIAEQYVEAVHSGGVATSDQETNRGEVANALVVVSSSTCDSST